MKKLRWQLIIIFLTGLVVGILLLGEQPGFQALVSEPTQGGTYTEALVGSLQRLNPLLDFANSADRDVNRLIFSGLLRFDSRGMPQADLAESWGITQDGTVYNFVLRPGLVWHDGEPLTADDVLFTIDLLRSGGEYVPADLSAFWENVDVQILSETTFQFLLPEPFAPFADYLTFGILPGHLLGGMSIDEMVDSSFNLEPVGSGPFKFERLMVENEQITGVVLSAFDQYYGQKPYLEQVIFRYYPDPATALRAYQEDAVQGISSITPDVLNAVLMEPDLALYTGRRPELALVLLNLNRPEAPFFQDAAIRKALLQGINRQKIVNTFLQGQAILTDGPIMPGLWAYYDGLKRIDYDPEAAREVLKEAGYVVGGTGGDTVRSKDSIVFSFELLYPDTEKHRQIAEAIQQQWSLLDIKVQLTALSYDELIYGRLEERDYQAALVDLNLSRTPDPDPYPFWDQAQATGGQNYSQWDHRTASEMLEEARISTDYAERARLYRNFQVIFAEEMPSLPLYYPVYTYAVDRSLLGVQMGPVFDSSDRFSTILNWHLATRRQLQRAETATPTGEEQ